MEFLYLVGFYLGFYILYKIFSFISGLIEKRHQRIRDEVATELFSNSGIETVIENTKGKLADIKFAEKPDTPKQIPYWQLSRLPKYLQKIINTQCPVCNKGYLQLSYIYNGYGRVPSLLSCSRKPECNYNVGIQTAKKKFQQINTDGFKKDFNQAYQ